MKRAIFLYQAAGVGGIYISLLGNSAVAAELPVNRNIGINFCETLMLSTQQPLPFLVSSVSPSGCDSYQAQVQPPADRFPQRLPGLEPLPEEGTAEPTPPQVEPTPNVPPDAPVEVLVETIQVVGSTVFSAADLAAVVSAYEGQVLSSEQLAEAADAVTRLYVENGYITTRATLPEQAIADGTVEIQVIEGELEEIRVEGNQRLQDSYIRSRIARATAPPLNQFALEEQLRLLQLDPTIESVEASLQSGTGAGQSILTLRVQEKAPFVSQFSFDNFSPDSVGSERFGARVGYLNPLGLGDEVYASAFLTTTGGSEVYEIGYRVPLNSLDGTLQLSFMPSSFEITDDAASFGLDIDGSADVYAISFRQPLVRSLREEFALSLGFRRREGQTLISDIVFDSSRVSVLQFGQDYLKRDARGAWALRSQFNLGTGLFGVTERPANQADGYFFSWLGQVQRVQTLNDRHTLIVQGDLQLSGDQLLPSEQFVIGGGQSLRGYEQNRLFGDSGLRLSVEDRITISRDSNEEPIFQVAPFVDLGTVWSNGPSARNEDFLLGIGTGLIWRPLPGLDMRLDLAIPVVSDRDDQGIFFNVVYRP